MILRLTKIPPTVWASGDIPKYQHQDTAWWLRLAQRRDPDPDKLNRKHSRYWWMTRVHLVHKDNLKPTENLVIPPEAFVVNSDHHHQGLHPSMVVVVTETHQLYGRAGDFQNHSDRTPIHIDPEWIKIARTCCVCAPPLRTEETLYAGPRWASYPVWSKTSDRFIDPVQRWDRQ